MAGAVALERKFDKYLGVTYNILNKGAGKESAGHPTRRI